MAEATMARIDERFMAILATVPRDKYSKPFPRRPSAVPY
jgi:hypothetical protein